MRFQIIIRMLIVLLLFIEPDCPQRFLYCKSLTSEKRILFFTKLSLKSVETETNVVNRRENRCCESHKYSIFITNLDSLLMKLICSSQGSVCKIRRRSIWDYSQKNPVILQYIQVSSLSGKRFFYRKTRVLLRSSGTCTPPLMEANHLCFQKNENSL